MPDRDDELPTRRKPVSLARARAGGVLLVLAGLAFGYFFLYRPLVEAWQTGSLHYYFRSVLLAPAFVYAGIAVLVTDLRDGTTREIGPDGRMRFTRKGKVFLGGLIAVMLLAAGSWLLLLHVLGFREIV